MIRKTLLNEAKNNRILTLCYEIDWSTAKCGATSVKDFDKFKEIEELVCLEQQKEKY